jgi:hypothetical protein
MKLKALLAAVFVAGLAVSMAVAAPAEHGKGKNGTTTADTSSTGGTTTSGDTGHEGKGRKKGHARWAGCHPKRAAVLVGDVAGVGTDSFAMSVEGGNRVGKQLYGKQVTVMVADSAKVRRSGRAKLADLETGDLVLVQGKACKLDATALTLVAKKVVVLSPSDDDEDEDDEAEGTSTTTSSTTTSTTSTSTAQS